MARWKSPISVLGCSNSEFDVTRYLRNIWCFVMSVKTSVIFPSDCWWRNWWISWKEFPKPSLPPAGRTKKFRGNKRKGKKVMQIQKRVCTWLWKNVEKSNWKITVMISDCFLGHWKTSSMCGRGSDATACTRSTQPSAKCSLWVIHRKWWEPLHFPDWMHSCIPVLCQVWLNTADLLLMLSFCLRIPTVFFPFPGAIWGCAGVPLEFWLLIRKLQLDHPVSPWESFLRVWFIPPHHTSTGQSTRPVLEEIRHKPEDKEGFVWYELMWWWV